MLGLQNLRELGELIAKPCSAVWLPRKTVSTIRRGGFQSRLYHRRAAESAKLADMCSSAIGSWVTKCARHRI